MQKVVAGFLLTALLLLFIQREVITSGKIIFPANFLAQFYAPWSTEKFAGWDAGIPHKPIGADQIRFFYPARTFANDLWQSGQIPLWNPYIFAGNPHIADYQSAVFYPLNILYFLLPQITSWSLLIFLEPILAMIFTYLYLRFFSIERIAAFFGASMFGLSSFMTVWGQENIVVPHAALWLPLVLYGLEGYLRSNKPLYALGSAVALSFSFLAGFFQISFYIFVFSFIYGLVRMRQLQRKHANQRIPIIFGVFFLALGIAAIQVIPSIEGFYESPRNISASGYLFDTYLLPITHVLTLLAPDIFGNSGAYNFFGRGSYHETVAAIGVVPFIFAVYAALRFRSDKIVVFFTISAILTFFLTISSPITKFLFSLPLPLISTFLPSRIFILTTLSLSILSAFGLSYWLQKEDRKRLNYIMLLCFFLLAITFLYAVVSYSIYPEQFSAFNEYFIRKGGFSEKNYILTMIKNTALPLIALAAFFILMNILKFTDRVLPTKIRSHKRKFVLISILALSFFSQLYYFNKYLSLGYSSFLYPKHAIFSFLREKSRHGERFIAIGTPIMSNISTQEKVYSPEGLDPIFSHRYGQLVHAVKNDGKITQNIPRIEATLSELGALEKITDNPLRLRLLSLLGVRFIVYYSDPAFSLPPAEKFPEDKFTEVFRDGKWIVYEYNDALKRAFLAKNVVVYKDMQKLVSRLLDRQFNPKDIVLIEEPLKMRRPSQINDDGRVVVKRYEANRVELTAASNSDAVLFLSDAYYPGWKAYVDGKLTKIFRANGAFRAIKLSPGEQAIVFVYDPVSFKIGASITVFSLVVVTLLASISILRALLRKK